MDELDLPSTQESGHQFVDLTADSDDEQPAQSPAGSQSPASQSSGNEENKSVEPSSDESIDADVADLTNDVPVGRRGFEFNARNLFATWSQCPMGAAAVIDLIKRKFPNSLKSWIVGVELHADGNEHIHCCLLFNGRVCFRDPRFLDLSDGSGNVFHPNIRPIKPGEKNVRAVWHYCAKGGNFKYHNNPLFKDSTNFVKKHTDFQKWTEFTQRAHQLSDIEWPIELPWKKRDNPEEFATLARPTAFQKRRHLWLHGPPNWGKSLWLSIVFRLSRVYMRPDNSDKPFDAYQDEEVIIYDDVDMSGVKLTELQSIASVWYTQAQVPGIVRYTHKFWKLRQVRTIIVLSNFPPIDFYNKNYAAFEARFNVVDLGDYPSFTSLYQSSERGAQEASTESNLQM